jgi:hypothetical protein
MKRHTAFVLGSRPFWNTALGYDNRQASPYGRQFELTLRASFQARPPGMSHLAALYAKMPA